MKVMLIEEVVACCSLAPKSIYNRMVCILD